MAPWCGGCCFIFITIIMSLALIQVGRQIGGGDTIPPERLIYFIGPGLILGGIFGVIMYLALKYEWG